MLKSKIASLALAGLMTVGGTSVTAFAAEPADAIDITLVQIQNADGKSMLATDFVANPDSTQEIKLEVLTKIVAEYNSDLYAELLDITAQHEQFHMDATATQEENQASKELEVATIVESAKSGEITNAVAKEILDQMKIETAAIMEDLATIKSTKAQEDGQLKADSKTLGADLITEFSSENPDVVVINELLEELVSNQKTHLDIDYKYQAQIDELLAAN